MWEALWGLQFGRKEKEGKGRMGEEVNREGGEREGERREEKGREERERGREGGKREGRENGGSDGVRYVCVWRELHRNK